MRNTFVFAVVFTMAAGFGVTSEEDESTSLSYISYLERYATVQPAGQEETIEAVINLPLVSGDRIDTAREARVEVVLADLSIVWLDEYTSLSFDAVAFSRDTGGDRTVLFLSEGSLIVEVVDIATERRPTRIDSRSESLYLNQPGLYRIETTKGGSLRLEVWQGLAEASTTQGGVLVRSEYATELSGGQVSQMEMYQTVDDDFARWVEQRRQTVEGESALHVDTGYGRQASQLDNYGNWIYLESDNTWAWQPHVSSSWRPYTAGRWYWTNTGWNWVSYEPWGWLPYHYGSWYHTAGYGWVWGWNSYWSPAWVSWVYWPGYVGWCPVGYHSYWWGHHYGWHGGYYGHHGGGGGHGGGGHGGSGGTPRRDVLPRGTSSTVNSPRSSAVPRPADLSLNMDGRVRLAEVDGRGWSVVEAENFGSAHLTRMVKPGDVALRNASSAEGTVRSGTLRTASPSAVRTGIELDRAFRQGSSRSEPDVTRIMARDSSLSADDALTMARPVSTSSSSRATVGGTPATEWSAKPSVLNLHRSAGNLYRPTMDAQQSSQGLGSSSTRPTTIGGARSIDSTSSGSNSRQSLTSGTTGRTYNVQPQADVPSTTRPSGTSTSSGSSSSSTRSTSSAQGSRPVIVPRTSSSGTSSSTRSSSSSRSIPSRSTSSTSSGNSSSNRTYARSPSSPSGSRSSATSSSSSSRSPSGRSYAPSRSSSSSRSSASSSRSSSSSSRSSASSSRSSASSSRSSGSSSRSSASSSRSSSSGSSSSKSSTSSTSSSSGGRKR